MDLEAGQSARLVGEAQTRPFGSPPRLITGKNPPFGAEDWNLLTNYLEAPNPETIIILALESKLDERLRFSKKVKAGGLEVDCSPPKKAALPKWLAGELKNRGVSASLQVCGLIIERAGDDMKTLLGEAEKLSLFLGEDKTLSADIAKYLVSLTPEANIFELGESLGRHDQKKALATLLELLATENYRPVLGMITRHFRIIMQIKIRQDCLGRTRLGPEEARQLNMHPFVLEKTQGQAAAWSWPCLTEALSLLETAHLTLVTSGDHPPQTLLENLTLKLAALGQSGR
jgi:DNA polymerase-3 subunit delta